MTQADAAIRTLIVRASDGCQTGLSTMTKYNPYLVYYTGMWHGFLFVMEALNRNKLAVQVLQHLANGDLHMDSLESEFLQAYRKLESH